MGTDSSNREERGVKFTYEGDLVTATDLESGVAASGKSKAEALSHLSDALELHAGGGIPIEDEEEFLADIGLDVDEVADEVAAAEELEFDDEQSSDETETK